LAIIEGKYKEGGKTSDSERELQEMFQCGRGAVREALGSLQTMGLVQRFAGKGTFVSKSNVLDMRSPYAFWNEFHDISLEELVELRFALEPIAASWAAPAQLFVGRRAARCGLRRSSALALQLFLWRLIYLRALQYCR